jgi:hypothetical protein
MANGKYKLVERPKISEKASKLLNVQTLVDDRTNLFALHGFDLDISLEGLGNVNCTSGVHNVFMLAYMAWKGQLEATYNVHVTTQGLLAPLPFSI